MSYFKQSFLSYRVLRFARDLGAYFVVLVLAGYGISVFADRIAQRAAAPIAGLLNLGDGFKVVDSRATVTPVQTESRVLEGDTWLDNLKTKWQSDRGPSPSSLGGPAPGPAGDRNFSRPSDGRTHRTMCVRLCDGYYFPVSFATTEDKFERDEQVCARSCSSPARLYVYRNPGQEPEQMVSRDGLPYTKLPTAFQFRAKLDQSCKCTPDPWEQEAKDRHREYAELVARPQPVKVSETGRKKSSKAGRVTEVPASVSPKVPSIMGAVRVANASAGVPILNMQVFTAAQGSVPQKSDIQPAQVSLTSAPLVDAGGVSPPKASGPSGPSKVVSSPSGGKKGIAASGRAKTISTVAGGTNRASIPTGKSSRSTDWKVAVFTAR